MRWFWQRKLEPPPPAPDESLAVHSIVQEIEKFSLERARFEAQMRLEELKATAEERKEQRDYDRAQKEKNRSARQKAAADAREKLARKRAGIGADEECPLCKNPFRPDVTVAMVAKHREHAPLAN